MATAQTGMPPVPATTTQPGIASSTPFFEEDFVPTSFLDAVFSESSDHLQATCSQLLAHLDFYAQELSTDLTSALDRLHHTTTGVVAYTPEADLLRGTTRLEYYVDLLANSVHVMQLEVQAGTAQVAAGSDDTLATLAQLYAAQARMEEVAEVFALLQRLTGSGGSAQTVAPTAINSTAHSTALAVPAFHAALNAAETNAEEMLAGGPSPRRTQALDNIDRLIALEHVLDGMDAKGVSGAFRGFVGTLRHLRKRHVTE